MHSNNLRTFNGFRTAARMDRGSRARPGEAFMNKSKEMRYRIVRATEVSVEKRKQALEEFNKWDKKIAEKLIKISQRAQRMDEEHLLSSATALLQTEGAQVQRSLHGMKTLIPVSEIDVFGVLMRLMSKKILARSVSATKLGLGQK